MDKRIDFNSNLNQLNFNTQINQKKRERNLIENIEGVADSFHNFQSSPNNKLAKRTFEHNNNGSVQSKNDAGSGQPRRKRRNKRTNVKIERQEKREFENLIAAVNKFDLSGSIQNEFLYRVNADSFNQDLKQAITDASACLGEDSSFIIANADRDSMISYLISCSMFSLNAQEITEGFITTIISRFHSHPERLLYVAEGLEYWLNETIWEYSNKIPIGSERDKKNDPLLNTLAWIKEIIPSFQVLEEGYDTIIFQCEQCEALRKMELDWDNSDLENRIAAWIDLFESHQIPTNYSDLDYPTAFDTMILALQEHSESLWQQLKADNHYNLFFEKSVELIPTTFQIYFTLDFFAYFQKEDKIRDILFCYDINELLAPQYTEEGEKGEESEEDIMSNDEKVTFLISKAVNWSNAINSLEENNRNKDRSSILAISFIHWIRKLSENWMETPDCNDSRRELEAFLKDEGLINDKNFLSQLMLEEKEYVSSLSNFR